MRAKAHTTISNISLDEDNTEDLVASVDDALEAMLGPDELVVEGEE